MAQTKDGALKIAAQKANISVEEYLQLIAKGMKKCTKCKQWQPFSNFHKDNSRFDKLKAKCISCDYIPKTNRIGKRERDMKKEANLKWCRGCQKWLPMSEVPRDICKEHAKIEYRKHYQNSERMRRGIISRNNSRKRGIDPISADTQIYLLEKFENKCAYCNENKADTFDHIIPISKGGKTELDNIVPACRFCNSSKNNQDVWKWIEKTGKQPNGKLFSKIISQKTQRIS